MHDSGHGQTHMRRAVQQESCDGKRHTNSTHNERMMNWHSDVWKLQRITVYSSLKGRRDLNQADLSSSTVATANAAASAVASSPENSDVGNFADDSAAAAATGWLSCTGCSVSVAGGMFGTDNAVDDGWNLP